MHKEDLTYLTNKKDSLIAELVSLVGAQDALHLHKLLEENSLGFMEILSDILKRINNDERAEILSNVGELVTVIRRTKSIEFNELLSEIHKLRCET